MEEHRTVIERYSGFLTHNDFVPHNLRVSGKEVYLLDYSSMLFGNKYESWARFLNFMIHHNRPLELALANYVRTNRGEEEYLELAAYAPPHHRHTAQLLYERAWQNRGRLAHS